MDITLGSCAEGDRQKCFQDVRAGLTKQDRAHVHLVEGNGKNGFKEGEYGITVDSHYQSNSGNFRTLQALANDHSAIATVDVLNGRDKFQVTLEISTELKNGQVIKTTLGTMTTFPDEAGGFAGYTFYPYGKNVPGPWSVGDFTDVVVNASRGDIPETIHHELRHVLLGDFGRKAPYGAHGTGQVDKQTAEAEKEASRNKSQK